MKDSSQALRNHLSAPQEQRDFSWTYQLHQLMPFCHYTFVGRVTGPDNRGYIAIVMEKDERHTQEALTFFDVVAYSLERFCGIALMPKADENVQPDAILRFGAVWAFYEYACIGGPANIVSAYKKALDISANDPFNVVAKESDEMKFGLPSGEFFPLWVRGLIRQEIKGCLPKAEIRFQLLEQERYMLPFSIFIEIDAERTEEQTQRLRDQLTWFMPPNLPLTIPSSVES